MFQAYQNYFGGKNGAGTFHHIINQIRPHSRYVEPFLGSGAVLLRKTPARINIGADLDLQVIGQWANHPYPWLEVRHQDAMELIRGLTFPEGERTVLYLDPPYPLSSRSNQRPVYRHEMTDKEHVALLELIKQLPRDRCDVILSTYPNGLYREALAGWEHITFRSRTRTYTATEVLYMNYHNPEGLLHQYNYLGKDRTDRQRIKRKIDTHVNRLKRLPAAERNAIWEALKVLSSAAERNYG